MLTLGNAFADEPIAADRLLVLAIAFTGSVALWWCYFHRAEEIGVQAVRQTDSPSRLVGWGNYTLIAMVVGIIAIAVGDELAIADPGAPTTAGATALIFGGPAIFLLAQLGFMQRVTGGLSRPRLLACVALLLFAYTTTPLDLVTAVAAATSVLVAVAAADSRPEPDATDGSMAAP